jgi:hypothetical protein
MESGLLTLKVSGLEMHLDSEADKVLGQVSRSYGDLVVLEKTMFFPPQKGGIEIDISIVPAFLTQIRY